MIRSAALCLLASLIACPVWSQDQTIGPLDERTQSLLLKGVVTTDDILRVTPRVGKLGRPDALAFTGVESFPESQLRSALFRDFDVVLAAHAHAKLADYLKTLERRITEGYQTVGFPDVQVSAKAEVEQQRIAIIISEGKRFHNGQVRVEGPKEIDAKAIESFLTDISLYDPAQLVQTTHHNSPDVMATKHMAFWTPGNPSDFFEPPARRYGQAIKAGLAALGYFYPDFKAELKPGSDGKADLCIRVTEPGAKAVVGQISVYGLEHHASEEILRFLGIRPGLEVDLAQKQAWEDKLEKSLCFLESRVAVLPAIAPGAPSDVEIHLVEQPQGPRLGEPLSDNDRLFTKTAQWISDWHQGNAGDLVYLNQSGLESPVDYLVIASPGQGFLVDAEIAIPDRPDTLRYTLVITKDDQRWVCWHSRRVFRIACKTGQFRCECGFDYRPSETDPEKWALHIRYRFGATPRRSAADDELLVFSAMMAPSLAVAAGRDPFNEIQEQDGVVSADKKGAVTRISRETGELLSVEPSGKTIDLKKLQALTAPRLDQEAEVAYFQKGAFQRFMQMLEKETAGIPSAYNPQRPVSSAVELGLKEAELISQWLKQERPLGIVTRLIELDALRPFDLLWIDTQREPFVQGNFRLPTYTQDSFRFFGVENLLPTDGAKGLARMAYSLHGLVVPPESGPARVAWDFGLVCIGRNHEAAADLEVLPQSPAVGPLTCWYASRVFGMFHKPLMVGFAKTGLEKLDEASFRREMEHLLTSESLLVELMGSLANALRQLDDDEFAQLVALFGERIEDPRWTKWISQIRQEQGKPSREILIDGFVKYWTMTGQAQCKERLEKLASVPTLKPGTNLDDLTLNKLFPDKDSAKEEKPAEKPAKKKLELFEGDLAPLSNP